MKFSFYLDFKPHVQEKINEVRALKSYKASYIDDEKIIIKIGRHIYVAPIVAGEVKPMEIVIFSTGPVITEQISIV